MFLTDISGQVQHDNLSKAVLTTGITGATRGNYLVNCFYRGSTKQSEITMAFRSRRHCNLPKIKKIMQKINSCKQQFRHISSGDPLNFF